MRDSTPKGRHLPIVTVAENICGDTAFARDGSGLLYVYEEGVYRPTGEGYIARRVKGPAQEWRQEGLWTPTLADSVAAYISADAPLLWDKLPSGIVNIANGLLYLERDTGVPTVGIRPKLKPHSKNFLSTIQLPVKYEPDARCPDWERFVGDTFPEDAQDLAWEIAAWLIFPTPVQKAVILTGEGANGKSRFLCGLNAMFGKSRAS